MLSASLLDETTPGNGDAARYILKTLQECLVIDLSVPTCLVWSPNYSNHRVTPGAKAGQHVKGNTYGVTVKGRYLNVRHVIWMLANGRILPAGHDVYFRNSPADLSPENLYTAPKNDAKAHNVGLKVREGAPLRRNMPNACILTTDSKGIYQLRIFTGNKTVSKKTGCIIYVGVSRAEVIKCAFAFTIGLGYLPNFDIPGLDSSLKEQMVDLAKVHYDKDKYFKANSLAAWLPSQREIVFNFLSDVYNFIHQQVPEKIRENLMNFGRFEDPRKPEIVTTPEARTTARRPEDDEAFEGMDQDAP